MKIKKEIKKKIHYKTNLYKPISSFKWQDATKEEIEEESIPHLKDKFKL